MAKLQAKAPVFPVPTADGARCSSCLEPWTRGCASRHPPGELAAPSDAANQAMMPIRDPSNHRDPKRGSHDPL
jgi:hypothetical protein